jgi:cellulose synthase/poly-beta-1,6-N-acetylglucosamine synthase-like glycosyltransferase
MIWAQYIFFISCFIVFYNYGGYAVLAWLFTRLRSKKEPISIPPDFTPSVSFIVAAYNEESIIREKLVNSLELDYPSSAIEYLFVTDGSNDSTPSVIGEFPSIRLLHNQARSGKSAAVNRAVKEARNEILIFSDANTTLNKDSIRNIARHYYDRKVGGVAGEKKVISLSAGQTSAQSADAEGLYWKYESRLKKIDSDFHSVVGAAGELFSLRRDLYEVLPENTILDDFVLSLRVAAKGYRIIYEPHSYAMELPSSSLGEERKRKVRIAAGGFQSILMLATLLAFWRRPALSFLYISHRVLRWTLSPLCLILALVSNTLLLWAPFNVFFFATFCAQLLFYALAAGYQLPLPGKWKKICKVPYYFTFMNVSVILGFFRFLKGSQSAVWEKAQRSTAPASPVGNNAS